MKKIHIIIPPYGNNIENRYCICDNNISNNIINTNTNTNTNGYEYFINYNKNHSYYYNNYDNDDNNNLIYHNIKKAINYTGEIFKSNPKIIYCIGIMCIGIISIFITIIL